MNNPTLVIKRTKEELRRYNIFNMIDRNAFMRLMQFMGPLFGLGQIIVFFITSDYILLVLGIFLIIYPLFIRRIVRRSSDRAYDQNNLQDFEVNITFNDDHFILFNDEVKEVVQYSEIFAVYNQKLDLYIFLDKRSGITLAKDKYDEAVLDRVLELLRNGTELNIK